MAVLDESSRAGVHSDHMEFLSARRDSTGVLLKPDLRAAVDAVDDWVDSNASSFNAALPEPAKSVMTAAQKAELLLFVVKRRWEIL